MGPTFVRDLKRFSKDGFTFAEVLWREEIGQFYRVERGEAAQPLSGLAPDTTLLGRVFPPLPPGLEDKLGRLYEHQGESSTLRHPHLLPLYGHGKVFWSQDRSERIWVVMGHFDDGQRLSDLDHGGLRPQATAIIHAIGSALAELHARGLAHGALGLDAIVRTPDGIWKLRPALEGRLTAEYGNVFTTGSTNFTYTFVSPETLNRDAPPDGFTDVFSLCGIWYWLLTGQRPFESNSLFRLDPELLGDVKATDPRQHVPGIPTSIVQILMAGLAIPRERRYKRVQQLLSDLKCVAEGKPPPIATQLTDSSNPQGRSSALLRAVGDSDTDSSDLPRGQATARRNRTASSHRSDRRRRPQSATQRRTTGMVRQGEGQGRPGERAAATQRRTRNDYPSERLPTSDMWRRVLQSPLTWSLVLVVLFATGIALFFILRR